MVEALFDTIFEGYAYSYPHKHSYRRLDPIPLSPLWEKEKKDALFLYIHLPFCEMRCGFCNLFTIANPGDNQVDRYLDTLAREGATLKKIIKPERFGQMAVGGGTPTFLDIRQLKKLFTIIRQLGAYPEQVPVSFEMSPKTITPDKLAFLKDQGVDRVSMGVQSFVESEVKALGRPQKNKEVYEALDLLKEQAFETLNIDLIYGAYGQTLSSWQYSVREAIRYGVQEIFIYPLYVRPLTGITKLNKPEEDLRFSFYRLAKQLLLEAGYEQISMRMFRLRQTQPVAPHAGTLKPIVTYSCQEDGMIGIGAGARSYTKNVHYSSEYAVARHNIRSIIESYTTRSAEDFHYLDYGIVLSREEQQRRYLIKSLLHYSGLDIQRYQALYDGDVMEDFPALQLLVDQELAWRHAGCLRLTDMGIDYSDAIGPWLYSAPIKQLINEFTLQ